MTLAAPPPNDLCVTFHRAHFEAIREVRTARQSPRPTHISCAAPFALETAIMCYINSMVAPP
jgi:hypothetical protein